MGIEGWRRNAQDRDQWRRIAQEAKADVAPIDDGDDDDEQKNPTRILILSEKLADERFVVFTSLLGPTYLNIVELWKQLQYDS
jgi:hypothetical protein